MKVNKACCSYLQSNPQADGLSGRGNGDIVLYIMMITIKLKIIVLIIAIMLTIILMVIILVTK